MGADDELQVWKAVGLEAVRPASREVVVLSVRTLWQIMKLICPRCPGATRTQFSQPANQGDLCPTCGWVEAVEMFTADEVKEMILKFAQIYIPQGPEPGHIGFEDIITALIKERV